MDSAKDDLADKLKSANNILVTVSRNPSVDQLAACLGLTLLLNKLGKHAAAIFSGEVPSTIEFLQPEETLEKNTDSLRDFIIALDKSKADKLRYKVEDNVVRIFITPYRTSISEKDLEFSQGDFNVDVVVALGVRQQEDLDAAITAHGRILHDAVVASINTSSDGGLGSISWHDPQASSLSELVTDLALAMGDDLLDSQIATALLTGIVAATERFSNDKTSSQTMNASARLMTAGANQQLVASKLEAAPPIRTIDESADRENDTPPPASDDSSTASPDGTLEIRHDKPAMPPVAAAIPEEPAPPPVPENREEEHESASLGPAEHHEELELPTPQFKEPPQPSFQPISPAKASGEEPRDNHSDHATPSGGLMTQAPTLGGVLTANTQPEGFEATTDPLSLGGRGPSQLLDHTMPGSKPDAPTTPPAAPFTPPVPQPWEVTTPTPPAAPAPPPEPADFVPPAPSFNPAPPPAHHDDFFESTGTTTPPADGPDKDGQTLADIERSVHSPHLDPPDLGAVRDEVSKALVSSPTAAPREPLQSLSAQPLGSPLHPAEPVVPAVQPAPGPSPVNPGNVVTPVAVVPDGFGAPLRPPIDNNGLSATAAPPQVADPTAPPPVPPPIPFQFGGSPPASNGPMMPL